MRTCDLCNQFSPTAKSLDYVILSILKEAQLTNSVRGDILEKLSIKHSVLTPKPSFGDVCEVCGSDLGDQISEVVENGISTIVDNIVELARKTKAKMPNKNQQLFAQVAGEQPWETYK